MSSDLISRQAAIDILLEKLIQNGDMYLAADAPKWVESLQTAFDKEKVIEEFMKYSGHPCTLNECGIRSEYCSVCMAKKAIEIVEKGGIE